MADLEVFTPEDIKGPDDLRPDDDAEILDLFGEDLFALYHVRRLGHMISVGSDQQPLTVALICIKSPGDQDYAAMVAEGRPEEGIPPHHPV